MFRFGIETLLERPESAKVYVAGYDDGPGTRTATASAATAPGTPAAGTPTVRAAAATDATAAGADEARSEGSSGRLSGTKSFETADLDAAVERLSGKRIALLAHPASVDREVVHSVDRLRRWLGDTRVRRVNDGEPGPSGARLSALFGPQHGLRGEKQDNMIESDHFTDPATALPVYSLYGESRRLTEAMADSFDVLFIDLQDVGVRVYTFLTTMCYMLEDLDRWPQKEIWVLDRPNPTGRAMDGLRLEAGRESFVGIGPLPMQHGLTLGEAALWYHAVRGLRSRLTVVPMTGWDATDPAFAWPADRVWVQPSPNMPGLFTTRCYPGTVMLEGTTISEGRGTTRPLSTLGHPDVDWTRVLERATELSPVDGCRVRRVSFLPTFQKHAGIFTPGIEIIAEKPFYDASRFHPFRFVAALLKAIRQVHPGLTLWTEPPYEYEYDRIPIDVITGGDRFRKWVDDPAARWTDLENEVRDDLRSWGDESARFRLYGGASVGA